jgi:hypothetical protein
MILAVVGQRLRAISDRKIRLAVGHPTNVIHPSRGTMRFARTIVLLFSLLQSATVAMAEPTSQPAPSFMQFQMLGDGWMTCAMNGIEEDLNSIYSQYKLGVPLTIDATKGNPVITIDGQVSPGGTVPVKRLPEYRTFASRSDRPLYLNFAEDIMRVQKAYSVLWGGIRESQSKFLSRDIVLGQRTISEFEVHRLSTIRRDAITVMWDQTAPISSGEEAVLFTWAELGKYDFEKHAFKLEWKVEEDDAGATDIWRKIRWMPWNDALSAGSRCFKYFSNAIVLIDGSRPFKLSSTLLVAENVAEAFRAESNRILVVVKGKVRFDKEISQQGCKRYSGALSSKPSEFYFPILLDVTGATLYQVSEKSTDQGVNTTLRHVDDLVVER